MAKLEGDWIVYINDSSVKWKVSIPDVAVVGEYTNEDAPGAPSYFYVFVTCREEWYELPVLAFGCDAVMEAVGERLGFKPTKDLLYSVTFESIIIWPPEMKSKPLFQFVESKRWWTRLWPGPMWTGLSGVVQVYLGSKRTNKKG